MTPKRVFATKGQVDRLTRDVLAVPNEPRGAHLSDEDFLAYSTSGAAVDDVARIEAHLQSCPDCAAQMERLLDVSNEWLEGSGLARPSAWPRGWMAIAASLILAAGATGAWVANVVLSSRYDAAAASREQRIEEMAARLADNDRRVLDLEQLLTRAGGQGPPIAIRQVRGEPALVTARPDSATFSFVFNVSEETMHAAFHVRILKVVRESDSTEVWTADVPASQDTGRSGMTPVWIPSRILPPGDYLAHVTGRYPDAAATREFAFRVVP